RRSIAGRRRHLLGCPGQAIGKISSLFRRRPGPMEARYASLPEGNVLKGVEPEELISTVENVRDVDRTAYRPAVLVALDPVVLALSVEKVPGVAAIVANKFKNTAVQGIGSRFGARAQLPARSAAKLRRVLPGVHREFFDGVGIGINVCSEALRVHIVEAIEMEAIILDFASVDAGRYPVHKTGGSGIKGGGHWIGGPGHEHRQRGDVTIVEGQLDDGAGIDSLSQRRRVGIDQRRLPRYLYRRVHLSYLQLEITTHVLVDLDQHP